MTESQERLLLPNGLTLHSYIVDCHYRLKIKEDIVLFQKLGTQDDPLTITRVVQRSPFLILTCLNNNDTFTYEEDIFPQFKSFFTKELETLKFMGLEF